MSKMQSPDEGNQRAHLPQAAEVEVPEVRQSQDAEAEVTHECLRNTRRLSHGEPDANAYPGRFVDVHDLPICVADDVNQLEARRLRRRTLDARYLVGFL
jgi:hypothetical protein